MLSVSMCYCKPHDSNCCHKIVQHILLNHGTLLPVCSPKLSPVENRMLFEWNVGVENRMLFLGIPVLCALSCQVWFAPPN